MKEFIVHLYENNTGLLMYILLKKTMVLYCNNCALYVVLKTYKTLNNFMNCFISYMQQVL